MLGLPSTTEVNRRIPKEAFYGHLKMNGALKASFVNDIDRITVRNSLKPGTLNISVGENIAEILVVEVALKTRVVPQGALGAIATANKHKLLFACVYGAEMCFAVMSKDIAMGQWMPSAEAKITPDASSMDRLWDSLASQIIYGDEGCAEISVEDRYVRDAKLKSMREDLVKLEARCMKEKQFVKKNELFERARKLKSEIAAYQEGSAWTW